MPKLPPPRNTIHVVDDDPAFRDSLCVLLTANGFAAEPFQDGPSFLKKLPEIRAGCALIDVNMPGISGLDVLAAAKLAGNDLPCIIMTGFGEVPLAVKAMKAGAVDFVEKPFDDEILIGAVRNALEKNPETSTASQSDPRLARLTPRERDVMAAMVRGLQNKMIAHELGISPRTVEIHRARLMAKLEASSVAEIVRISLQSGLPPT